MHNKMSATNYEYITFPLIDTRIQKTPYKKPVVFYKTEVENVVNSVTNETIKELEYLEKNLHRVSEKRYVSKKNPDDAPFKAEELKRYAKLIESHVAENYGASSVGNEFKASENAKAHNADLIRRYFEKYGSLRK